jgi:hypothetical protein
MATFRESLKRIAPSWLNGDVGAKLLHSLGIVLDALGTWMDYAVKARFPGHAGATPTALSYIGNDRLLERYPNESDSAYATRLRAWLDTWRTAGNARSIIDQVVGYLGGGAGVFVRIAHNTGRTWYVWNGTAGTFTQSSVGAPGNWNWDGQSSRWWRFFLIITVPDEKWTLPATATTWGGAGRTWGQQDLCWGNLLYKPTEVAAIRALVDRWKPAHAVCVAILVNAGPTDGGGVPIYFMPGSTLGVTNPDGDHGNWSKNVGGVQQPSRFPQADYWDGVE